MVRRWGYMCSLSSSHLGFNDGMGMQYFSSMLQQIWETLNLDILPGDGHTRTGAVKAIKLGDLHFFSPDVPYLQTSPAWQILRFSDRFAICHCFCCGIPRRLSNYTLAAKFLTSSFSHWSERTGVFGVLWLRPTQLAPARQPAHPVSGLTSTPPTPDSSHIRPYIHTAFSSSWPLQSYYVAACTFFFSLLVFFTCDTLDWHDQPASCFSNSPPLFCLRPPILPFSALGISLQPTNVAYFHPVQSQVPRRYQS
jgi:hypothetical protein